MFIATKIWFDPETFLPIVWDGYEYDGPLAECKKGRETVEQNAALAQQQAKQNNANSQQQYGVANNLENEAIGNTTPGSLSPAATAQLASDTQNIGRVYNGMRQTAFATMGQRGFGNAPSGFNTAAQNGIDQGQANQETGAYRNAQQNTQAQRNLAMGTAAGMSGQQGNLGIGNTNSSTDAAFKRSQMGSTLGDIGQGISTAAGIAGNIAGMGIPGAASGLFKGGSPFALMGSNAMNAGNIAGLNTYMNPGDRLTPPGISGVGSYGGR